MSAFTATVADAPASSHARRAERAYVHLPADLRKSGEPRARVDVLDISVHGFRIETHRSLRVDTPVWLTLPGLQPIAARVVRQVGPDVGCEFLVPLHPAVLGRIVSIAK